MASTTFNRVLAGTEDLLVTASSATVNQLRDGPLLAQTKAITPLNTANFPLSTAVKTAVAAWSAFTGLDQALQALNASVVAATTTTAGISKMSAAPAVAGIPISMEQNDPVIGRIPTAFQDLALDAADDPGADNPYLTSKAFNLATSMHLGSGKDGHGYCAAISAVSACTAVVGAAGNLTVATASWKIAAYNLSGATTASAATANLALTAQAATLTLPALPANATGYRIYRSSNGANWYFVGNAVKGFNYFETGTNAFKYTDDNAYPDTSLSAPGSDTTGNAATASGLYEWLTFTFTASQTITVASTGNFAGYLDFRIRGLAIGSNLASVITGVGAHAVNIGNLRRYASVTGNGVGSPGMFQGLSMQTVGFGPTIAAGATSTYATTTVPAQSLGADASLIGQNLAGFGTKGNTGGGTGGNGGAGGPMVRIWAYQFATNTFGGTITATGGAGSASSGSCAGGGGGGAGGLIDIGAVIPWRDTGTRTASGGAGGNTVNTGGASTVYGGPGGGGGAIIRRNCYDKTGATSAVAAGAAGANTTTATATQAGPQWGGSHYGDGGITVVGSVSAATAGQQFDFNGFTGLTTAFAS